MYICIFISICMYEYICMYVCMYVCMNVYIYSHTSHPQSTVASLSHLRERGTRALLRMRPSLQVENKK